MRILLFQLLCYRISGRNMWILWMFIYYIHENHAYKNIWKQVMRHMYKCLGHMKHESIWTDKMRSLYLEVIIGSLLVETIKQIKCESLHLEAVIESFLMKAAKTIWSLYLGGTWLDEILLLWRHVVRWDPFTLKARG